MIEAVQVPINAINPSNSLSQARALYSVFGRDGLNQLRAGIKGNELDEHLLAGFTRAYDIPSGIDPRVFIDKMAVRADYVMNDIVSRIFPNNGRLIRPSEETLEALRLSPSNALNNDFEQNRRLILMHALTQQELRKQEFNFEEKRRELDYVLTQLVCDPSTATTIRFFSEHQPDTLKTLGLSIEPTGSVGSLVKQHEYEVYEVPGVGKVTSWTRTKDDVVTVLKSAEKSLKRKDENYNNGVINVNKQVRDPIGGIILVDEDENMEPVMANAWENLEEYFGDRLDRIEEDHATNPHRGSAMADLDFLRLQVYLKDMLGKRNGEVDTPLEVIIDSVQRYTDRVFYIGEKDPDTQLYTGPAEDMYGLRRVSDTSMAFVRPDLQSIVAQELPEVAEVRAQDLRDSAGLVRPTFCNINR